MIESIGKNIHFKSAPVAPIPPVQPPMDQNMIPVTPVAAVPNPLERTPKNGDAFMPSGGPTLSPREMYEQRVREQQRGAEAAFRGLTTSSALVQSAERGNKAASKQLDIIA